MSPRRDSYDQAQLAMGRLFDVEEARADIERPAGYGGVKPGRNEFFSRALLEARELFPSDETAQRRFAERAANRAMHMNGDGPH